MIGYIEQHQKTTMKKHIKNFQELTLSENKAYNSKAFDAFMSSKDEYQTPKTLGSNRIQQIMDSLQDAAYDLDSIIADAGTSINAETSQAARECKAALQSALACMSRIANTIE